MRVGILFLLVIVLLLPVVYAQSIPGDDNGDGCVSLSEVSSYVGQWLNGQVTFINVSLAISSWLEVCQPPTSEIKLQIYTSTDNADVHEDANPIQNSFDSDILTRWSARQSSNQGTNNVGVSIIFNLGAIQEVRKIRFSPYQWNAGRIYQYSIDVSEDGVIWTNVVPQEDSDSIQWQQEIFSTRNARYVKMNFISQNQGSWAGLYEFEIYGYFLNEPINSPPLVNVVSSTSGYTGESINIDADAWDEGLPNPPGQMTYQWTKQSGPGAVTFTNANAMSTQATFSELGNYVLRFTAYDGQYTSQVLMNVEIINPPAQGDTILEVNFDNQQIGDYVTSEINSDWKNTEWVQIGSNPVRTQIIEGAQAYSGKSLRVYYPAGQVGPGNAGAQWPVLLPENYEDLTVSYKVKLQSGFEFQEGGKLPGFCGGACYTGGNNGLDGWSARIMWYLQGRVSQYVYYPGNVGYGEHFLWNNGGQRNLIPGQWHEVKVRIKMNDVGQANGLFQAWFDGQLAADKNDVIWRHPSAPTVGINKFYFSTFFGGNLASNAPDNDMYIYFDDFKFTTSN